MKREIGLLIMVLTLVACTSSPTGTLDAHPGPNPNPIVAMRLTSSAFEHGGTIPAKYTCDGGNVSPPLAIRGVPEQAQSLVLIMDDPDAPGGTWDHWVVFDVFPLITVIPENMQPPGKAGRNSSNDNVYGGLCPSTGEHRYSLRLFALDTMLKLPEGSSKGDIERAMGGHVLAQAELLGRYTRQP